MQEEQPPEQEQRPEADYSGLEDVFSDVFETHINPWSGAVMFGIRGTRASESARFTHRIRMPLQQAKALAVMLLRAIRRYEEQSGADIDLPKQVLDSLGIALEDWEVFRER